MPSPMPVRAQIPLHACVSLPAAQHSTAELFQGIACRAVCVCTEVQRWVWIGLVIRSAACHGGVGVLIITVRVLMITVRVLIITVRVLIITVRVLIITVRVLIITARYG